MKLLGWEDSNRIQFSLPKDRIGLATEVVPILFRVSSTTGYSKTDLTFVFDYMTTVGSSYASRKKVAFSQLVGGEEIQLYAELDIWDHVTKKALFWVKPIEISCTYENIFYFYYNKSKDDNILYISEAGDLSIVPFINTGADATYDIHGGKPMALIKKDDKYLFWYILDLVVTSYWQSRIYYCESTDLVSFTNFTICVDTSPDETSYYKQPGTIIYQDGIFKMWYSGNTIPSSYYNVIYYCTSLDGKVWENFTACSGLANTQNGADKSRPSVIFENGLYKMWFSGAVSGSFTHSIFYAESNDGINWVNLQLLFGESSIPYTINIMTLGRVFFKDALYHMWLNVSYLEGNNWRYTILYTQSVDGKVFLDFDFFVYLGLEGTYDLTSISSMVVFEEIPGLFYLLYTGKLDSFDCILKADSVSLDHPSIPSQKIWLDKFNSVHHFNPSFGYINSANINAPATLNNISSTYGNLGSYAIKFNSTNSYADLGNHVIYNYGNMSQVLLFGAIDYGNTIYSKGLYSECTSTLYYQQTPLLTRSSFDDTFSGTVGSIPDPYLWTVRYGAPTQNAGSLLFTQALDERIRTTFYVGNAGTNVQFDFNITGGDLTSGWQLSLRAGFVGDVNSDYLLSVVRPSTLTDVYFQGVHKDTYTSAYGSSASTPPVDYFSGKLRMVINETQIIFYYYYQDVWYLLRSTTLSSVSSAPYAFIEINKTQLTTSELTKFYVSNFMSSFNNSFFIRNATFSDSLVLEYRSNESKKFLPIPNFTLNSSWSTYTFSISAELNMLNTSIGELNTDFYYCTSSGTQVTTQSVILGSAVDGFTGSISDIFFFKLQPSVDTIRFFDTNLKDNLINISRNFLRGYTTKYNKTFSTTVLLYDQDTGDLLANTVSSSTDGFYYAEVPFKNNYFIVGLGDTLYNNFILSDITPQIIF